VIGRERIVGVVISACLVAGCDRSSPSVQRSPASSISPPASVSAPPLGVVGTGASSSPIAIPVALSASDLCVTEGAITPAGDHLVIDAPKFRAIAPLAIEPSVELRFTYFGRTAETAALGSGRVRTQIGLKLRARDACNLVYVMWRIEPRAELSVQVKRNPGERTSSECGNRGYRNVKPHRAAPVPEVSEGSSHVVRAEMKGAELTVWVDGALVWEGATGDDVLGLEGPVGLRTDNGRFAFSLSARRGGGARSCSDADGE
jgi:hypothetical protein